MKLTIKKPVSISLSAEEQGMLEDIQKRLQLGSKSEAVVIALRKLYLEALFPKASNEVTEIRRYLQLLLMEVVKTNQAREDMTSEEMEHFKLLQTVATKYSGDCQ